MNYQEIIKPYLIDFEKLEVGQTLWSVIDGEIKVKIIDLDDIETPIGLEDKSWYYKDGRGMQSDKYPTIFTSNPFENLQVVESKKTWNKPHVNIGKVDFIQPVNNPNKVEQLEITEEEIDNVFPVEGLENPRGVIYNQGKRVGAKWMLKKYPFRFK